jgi:hypothetical protein
LPRARRSRSHRRHEPRWQDRWSAPLDRPARPPAAAAAAASPPHHRSPPLPAALPVITGANRGIGLELARQLAARDARVIAACRRPAEARELLALAAGGRVEVSQLGDVADPEAVSRWAADLKGKNSVDHVDLLINNAGALVWQGLEATTKADMLRLFETNTIGPLLCTQALLREGLLKRGHELESGVARRQRDGQRLRGERRRRGARGRCRGRPLPPSTFVCVCIWRFPSCAAAQPAAHLPARRPAAQPRSTAPPRRRSTWSARA